MDRFAAARLKIERANKHIADLEQVIAAMRDSYTSTIERHEPIRAQVITYTFHIKMLHDLDVSDKHLLLIPVTRAADAKGIVVEDEHGKIETMDTSNFVTGDGPYSVCLPLECTIKDEGKLTVDVVFGNVDIALIQQMPVMDDLRTFSIVAVNVIERLESL